MPVSAGSASGMGDLNITVRDFPLGAGETALTNELISFKVDYACGSTTDPCKDIYIRVAVPADQFEFVSGDSSSGNSKIDLYEDPATFFYTGTINGTFYNNVEMRQIILETKPGSLDCSAPGNVCYNDGETSTATIAVRVKSDAYEQRVDYPITVDAFAHITDDGEDPDTDTPDVEFDEDGEIDEPNFDWSITKERVLPPESGALLPAHEEVTRYQIRVCPESNEDNWDLSNLVIWDDYDDALDPGDFTDWAGGDFYDDEDAGDAGNPDADPPDDPQPDTDYLEWTIGDASFTGGCVTKTITVEYPDEPPFDSTDVGGDYDYETQNVATYDADYGLGPQSVCDPTCPGSATSTVVSHSFDPAEATPDSDKSVAVNPVGVDGTGRWRISPDLTANAIVDGFFVIDELPWDDSSDGNSVVDTNELPLVMEGIRPGTWPQRSWFTGEVRATIYLSNDETCQDDTDLDITATSFNPAGYTDNIVGQFDRRGRDYGTSQSREIEAIPAPPAGTQWKCVRIDFEYDDDGDDVFAADEKGVPIGFDVRDGANAFEILFGVRGDDDSLTGTYKNCVDASRYIGASEETVIGTDGNGGCEDVTITNDTSNLSVDTDKSSNPSNPQPGEQITFTLELEVLSESSQPLNSPIVVDALPPTIVIDTSTNDFWDISYQNDDSATDTTLSKADIIGAGGVTVQTRNVDADGNPGTNDPEERTVITFDLSGLHIERPLTESKYVRIEITGMVQYFTEANTYTNYSYFALNDASATNLVCENPSAPVDHEDSHLDDIDDFIGDGAPDDGDQLCREDQNYQVPDTATLDGNKWLRNEYDPTNIIVTPGLTGVTCQDGFTFTEGGVSEANYSRYGCVHVGEEEDIFTYRLHIINVGNVDLFDYYLYDILPYFGDTGVSDSQVGTDRESEFRANMTSNGISFLKSDLHPDAPANTTLAASDFIIEYNASTDPCRPEVGVSTGTCDNTWSTDPITDFGGWENVRSFRIRTTDSSVKFEPGVRLEFLVEMQIPTAGTYSGDDDVEGGDIAWNNYAHVASYDDGGATDTLNPAEPRKVGILINRRGSIGNFVWYDTGPGADYNDREYDPGSGEVGVSGVRVELYRDVDDDGNFTTADKAGGFVTSTITGNPQVTDGATAPGYYLFDNLPAGKYFVHLPGSNFNTASDPLYHYSSSTDQGGGPTDASPNSFDNGIDPQNLVTTFGVTSPLITLTLDDSEADDDNDAGEISDDTADGPNRRGNRAEANTDSDLTVDFGFTQTYDWGDNPDSYGTDAADTGEGVGPSHLIVPELYLGESEDAEVQGQPSANSDGDDNNGTSSDDEDGVNAPTLVAGQTQNIEVTVYNNTGTTAYLIGWIDFDGSGSYTTADAIQVDVPSIGEAQSIEIPVDVPDSVTTGNVYSRWRLTTDPIDGTNPTGPASDGEVEDYQIPTQGPGVSVFKTDGQNAVVAGQSTTYTVTIHNSSSTTCSARFTDTIPIADPDGYDDTSISWTCSANGNATCIAGTGNGTGDSGTNNNIDEFITLDEDGEVVYEITATLRANATGAVPIVNTGRVDNVLDCQNTPVEDEDENGVIFDPPYGQKSGTYLGNDVIRWTMVWYNASSSTERATISDTLQANQTFNGNLSCNIVGPDTTQDPDPDGCYYDSATNTVVWNGEIGPEANGNQVEIAFDVLIPSRGTYTNTGVISLANQTAASTEVVRLRSNNTTEVVLSDDNAVDDIWAAEQDDFPDELPATGGPPIPTLPLWAWASIILALVGTILAGMKLRHI